METVKTNFNELVGLAMKMENNGEMIDAAKVRKWLISNGYKDDIRVSTDAVNLLWTGKKDTDILTKTVLLIEDNIRHDIDNIGDIYSSTCVMEEMDDIPDWKMTVCLNEGLAFCTEEYTNQSGKQTNTTVVAPGALAWFDSKALTDIFACSTHTYNITANSIIEKANRLLPHENPVKVWLDAFGFGPRHNVVVTLDSPAPYKTVLDGVYKAIFDTWFCNASQYPCVLEVLAKAACSILKGHDIESSKINEIRYTGYGVTLPHSLNEAESVLVRVWEKDKAAPSVTLRYIFWKGYLFDYEKSMELVKNWTTD